MFKSSLLEALSKVHFSVPIFIFGPVILYGVYRALTGMASIWWILPEMAAGLFVWTFVEYIMHCYVFHFAPRGTIGERLHFIFHGVHHDYPSDKHRLVLPPSVSIPLAFGFYLLYRSLVPDHHFWGFFSGFLLGYLVYDIGHYAMHHFNFKSGLFKKIKRHHMLHHYEQPEKGFGVSSPLWDKVFGSVFSSKMELYQRQRKKQG